MNNLLYCVCERSYHNMENSLLEKAGKNPAEAIRAYVITMNLSHLGGEPFICVSQAECDALSAKLSAINPENTVRRIDVTAMFLRHFESVNMEDYEHLKASLRKCAESLPMIPNKITYVQA